ncbi:MAG TPA: hypothetical protein VFI24_12165 [Pyrinomonadaceae bacterium]|nr:hypothetical protein [Pyrinomonadaceae bacterium]
MKRVLLLIVLNIVVAVSVVGQTRTEERARRRWWVSAALATVFDTNITHDERAVSAFGVVPSLGLHFRDNPERPSIEIDYEIGMHRYTNTDEFNRVSHTLDAVYRKQFMKRLYFRSTTEISLKGSSEDREVNNNYIFEQQLQYRFTSNTRVAALAAYRVKRYPLIDRDSNAIDSYVGGKIEQRFRGERRLIAGYRYDHNRAWLARNNYIRRTYSLEFETPLSLRRRDSLSAEFRYSPRYYQNRTTRVDGIRVPRHDDRWVFDVIYVRQLRPDLSMAFEYEFEKRNSNDIDKLFTSNAFGLRFLFNKFVF